MRSAAAPKKSCATSLRANWGYDSRKVQSLNIVQSVATLAFK